MTTHHHIKLGILFLSLLVSTLAWGEEITSYECEPAQQLNEHQAQYLANGKRYTFVLQHSKTRILQMWVSNLGQSTRDRAGSAKVIVNPQVLEHTMALIRHRKSKMSFVFPQHAGLQEVTTGSTYQPAYLNTPSGTELYLCQPEIVDLFWFEECFVSCRHSM